MQLHTVFDPVYDAGAFVTARYTSQNPSGMRVGSWAPNSITMMGDQAYLIWYHRRQILGKSGKFEVDPDPRLLGFNYPAKHKFITDKLLKRGFRIATPEDFTREGWEGVQLNIQKTRQWAIDNHAFNIPDEHGIVRVIRPEANLPQVHFTG